MPRSKRAADTDSPTSRERKEVVDNTLLASRTELEEMDKYSLMVQREKHVRLLNDMVGNLYPQMVSDIIDRIDELLEDGNNPWFRCEHGHEYGDPTTPDIPLEHRACILVSCKAPVHKVQGDSNE